MTTQQIPSAHLVTHTTETGKYFWEFYFVYSDFCLIFFECGKKYFLQVFKTKNLSHFIKILLSDTLYLIFLIM